MNLSRSRIAVSLALISLASQWVLQEASAQADDFDDGNADGWTELVPLADLGIPGTFSFPDGNAYRMQSAPSVDDDNIGPGRLGSMRADHSYDDFYMSVDLIDWDRTQDQNMGVLARIRQPGLGTLDGYGVTYNPVDQKMYLSVITDEGSSDIDADVFLDPGVPVRIVFQGSGPNLKAELFTLDDLITPVATLEQFDTSYTSGFCGIFNSADGGDAATDCTFDNYFAAAAEPLAFRITSVAIVGEMVVFEFLSRPGVQYSFWMSPDMEVWGEVDDGIVGSLGTETSYSTALPATGRMFYQFRRAPAPG